MFTVDSQINVCCLNMLLSLEFRMLQFTTITIILHNLEKLKFNKLIDNYHYSLKGVMNEFLKKKAHLREALGLNIDSQNNDNEYVSSVCNSHQSSRWQLCIDDIYQAALMKWWPGLCITAIIFITWSCYIYPVCVNFLWYIFAGNMWILTCMQNDKVQIQNISWQC